MCVVIYRHNRNIYKQHDFHTNPLKTGKPMWYTVWLDFSVFPRSWNSRLVSFLDAAAYWRLGSPRDTVLLLRASVSTAATHPAISECFRRKTGRQGLIRKQISHEYSLSERLLLLSQHGLGERTISSSSLPISQTPSVFWKMQTPWILNFCKLCWVINTQYSIKTSTKRWNVWSH